MELLEHQAKQGRFTEFTTSMVCLFTPPRIASGDGNSVQLVTLFGSERMMHQTSSAGPLCCSTACSMSSGPIRHFSGCAWTFL